jgi:thiosulfate/3-mercaptopyruvate sulfurtransferase
MANAISSPLISADQIPTAGGDVVIVDARSGPDGAKRYDEGHLAGAVHADLDAALTELTENPAHGGRHPLPNLNDFCRLLGIWGISPSSRVIVYDDKNGAFAAARFWWMLRSLGHARVQVVDGGFGAIVGQGLPLSQEVVHPNPLPPYPADRWLWPTVSLDEVAMAAKQPGSLVIDVREAFRYRGEREPIDLVAGHIPGAVNIPYLSNLTESGLFLPAAELAKLYHGYLAGRNPKDIIVHCGSGVTACHTLLALEHAGIHGAGLYVGSWSEWSRRDQPIATGEAP